MLGRLPGIDFPLLLEVDPGSENVYPLRQIIFDGGVAGIHPIAITDRMQKDPEILRQYLAAQGLETARPVEAFGPTEEIEWLTELMRTFGGTPSKSSVMDSGGPQKIQVVAIVRAHFRAVAKIGFHYALKMFPDLTGLEHEFGPIKDFIWNGGDVDRFVGQRGDQFVENFRRGARPTHWMHILAVVRTYERITAYAQFFAGPRSLPPGYEIDLGRDPARIRRPTERRAHQFVILDPNASIGIVGRMEDGNPANSIWVPT